MGEISIVGPGKTRGYPYPVCKKTAIQNTSWGNSHTSVGEEGRRGGFFLLYLANFSVGNSTMKNKT